MVREIQVVQTLANASTRLVRPEGFVSAPLTHGPWKGRQPEPDQGAPNCLSMPLDDPWRGPCRDQVSAKRDIGRMLGGES